MTVSGVQILQLCVVSSSSGSGQSEVTKCFSCIFEAEFSLNVAVKSAFYFHIQLSIVVKIQELSCHWQTAHILLKHHFVSQKHVKPRLGNSNVHRRTSSGMYVCMYVSFGQGSNLLWTHTLRPFYSRPIALTQEGRSLVNDVCVTEG